MKLENKHKTTISDKAFDFTAILLTIINPDLNSWEAGLA
jgi:hypothetical protein